MKPTILRSLSVLRFGATAGVLLCCWMFPSPFLNVLFSLIVLRSFFLFLRDFASLPKASWFFLIVFYPFVIFSVYYFPRINPVPYLAVIMFNLMVTFVFSSNLLRGKSNILVQFVKAVHLGPKPSVEFENYLRQQCQIWSVASLLSATLAGAAMMSEASRLFAGNGLIFLFLVQALWFVLSHEIARFRFERPETWLETLRLISQRNSWERLEF